MLEDTEENLRQDDEEQTEIEELLSLIQTSFEKHHDFRKAVKEISEKEQEQEQEQEQEEQEKRISSYKERQKQSIYNIARAITKGATLLDFIREGYNAKTPNPSEKNIILLLEYIKKLESAMEEINLDLEKALQAFTNGPLNEEQLRHIYNKVTASEHDKTINSQDVITNIYIIKSQIPLVIQEIKEGYITLREYEKNLYEFELKFPQSKQLADHLEISIHELEKQYPLVNEYAIKHGILIHEIIGEAFSLKPDQQITDLSRELDDFEGRLQRESNEKLRREKTQQDAEKKKQKEIEEALLRQQSAAFGVGAATVNATFTEEDMAAAAAYPYIAANMDLYKAGTQPKTETKPETESERKLEEELELISKKTGIAVEKIKEDLAATLFITDPKHILRALLVGAAVKINDIQSILQAAHQDKYIDKQENNPPKNQKPEDDKESIAKSLNITVRHLEEVLNYGFETFGIESPSIEDKIAYIKNELGMTVTDFYNQVATEPSNDVDNDIGLDSEPEPEPEPEPKSKKRKRSNEEKEEEEERNVKKPRIEEKSSSPPPPTSTSSRKRGRDGDEDEERVAKKPSTLRT